MIQNRIGCIYTYKYEIEDYFGASNGASFWRQENKMNSVTKLLYKSSSKS